VKYKRLPAVGPLATRAAGSLRTFLWEIPNLFYFGRVPSLQVVNAFLQLGVADAGMSGGARWKPFAISPDEYDEVVAELRAANPSYRGLPLVFSEVRRQSAPSSSGRPGRCRTLRAPHMRNCCASR
jgi:hypothetical protein